MVQVGRVIFYLSNNLTTTSAANATSHLFFAYLRALAPEQTTTVSGISKLPRSLQALLSQTEYPPEPPSLMQSTTTKVVMIVQDVSPTPFALLRRARNFEYREDDQALQEFSDYDDPVRALTEECRRVMTCISTTNQSAVPIDGNAVQDPSWSRFEDVGFNSIGDHVQSPGDLAKAKSGMRSPPGAFNTDFNRPTTPSWADFLSSGFAEEKSPTLLPPDKQLPLPVGPRAHSSQSHRPRGDQIDLEPGELASITTFDLDETFWWVWMTSLAGEEPAERKSVFGRCALIETHIQGATWLLIEEQVEGASPGQDEGVYLAEKKSRFSFTRRGRLSRKKTIKKSKALEDTKEQQSTMSLNRISPEKHEQIHKAAKRLARGDKPTGSENMVMRRSRLGEDTAAKTTSTMSVGNFMNEAGAALKWTNHYDNGAIKEDIRQQYMLDPAAGTGKPTEYSRSTSAVNLSTSRPVLPDGLPSGISTSTLAPHGEYDSGKRSLSNRDLPALPVDSNPGTSQKSTSPPATPPHVRSSRDSRNTQFLPDEKIAVPLDPHLTMRNDSVDSAAAPLSSVGSPPSPGLHTMRLGQEQKKVLTKDPASSTGLKKLFGRKRPTVERADTPTENTTERLEEQTKPTVPASRPIVVPEFARSPEPVKIPDSPPRSVYNEPTFNLSPFKDAGSAVANRDDARRAALDQLEAEDEFARFDQGPIDEMPAFVPADDADADDDESAAPSPVIKQHANNSRPAGHLHPGLDYPAARSISPARKPIAQQMRFPVKTADAPAGSQPSTTSDRWAQIRKNAAERAARINEEQQKAQSQQHGRNHSASARSDDGETSGEETIESRVARIKARVAELTGKAANFV